jgi:hypothetical protein
MHHRAGSHTWDNVTDKRYTLECIPSHRYTTGIINLDSSSGNLGDSVKIQKRVTMPKHRMGEEIK